MHQCPKCKSDKIHFSRSRSKWESWRKKVTGKRPYRCPDCGWRGWGPDTGPRFSREELESSSLAVAPDPPNLKDTPLAREERRPMKLDLGELDNVIPPRREPAKQD
jgi:predicted RNA-binding Zn-ribbon protein involved in translation (DUF1610 family)